MRFAMTTPRVICSVAFLLGCVSQAHAQFGVGSMWVLTDTQSMGLTLKVEACCNGGLRLIYQIPATGGQPAAPAITIDSPMDGREVPALLGGKPTGQTMAVTRVDDHHYNAVVKMNGQPFSTSTSTVSPDGKTMTVETLSQAGGKPTKTVQTWVRQ